MNTIKYLLVNETSNEKAARAIRDSKLPDIGFHHIVEAGGLSRGEVIDQLRSLRKHYPEAKILGVGELGDHCVHPSERMNRLRRELSDLPYVTTTRPSFKEGPPLFSNIPSPLHP